MTDYLEEALEGLDTLARRLQRARTAVEETEENGEYFRERAGKIENRARESKNRPKSAERMDILQAAILQNHRTSYDTSRGEARFAGTAPADSVGEQEEVLWLPASSEGQSVLSVQEGEGGSLPLRSPETAWLSGGEETGQTSGEASTLFCPSTAEEVNWAEQTDRVFRRDSRRYDGSFCLY